MTLMFDTFARSHGSPYEHIINYRLISSGLVCYLLRLIFRKPGIQYNQFHRIRKLQQHFSFSVPYPIALPPCTPSYPATFSPTCPFISPPITTNSSCPVSSTILLSASKNSSFSTGGRI